VSRAYVFHHYHPPASQWLLIFLLIIICHYVVTQTHLTPIIGGFPYRIVRVELWLANLPRLALSKSSSIGQSTFNIPFAFYVLSHQVINLWTAATCMNL
jgi:hypothetical protein